MRTVDIVVPWLSYSFMFALISRRQDAMYGQHVASTVWTLLLFQCC